MTPVTKYKAVDGRLFNTELDCLKHEAVLTAAEAVDRILPKAIDDGCKFANGHGYIQHTQAQVNAFKDSLAGLISLECGKEQAQMFRENPLGIVGRYLSDGNRASYGLLIRLTSIDSQLREWGQPFFANNPDQGGQVEWPNVEGRAA